jgi:hypothetical protein
MGKRELLLVVAFMTVGAVVYQATAPPAAPGTRDFSLSRLIETARREIRGNRARVETVRAETLAAGPDIMEIRIVGTLSEIEVVGSDRTDVETELRVVSNAYDEAEAKRYADETVLTSDRSASGLTLKLVYPEGRHTGIQRGMLALRVPARLRVRVESRTGKLQVRGVAAVEATSAGGTTTIKEIAGRVNVTQRGGRISIEDAAAVKFTGRSSEATVAGVTGDASFSLEAGGELTATRLGGPVDVEARNAEVSLDHLEDSRGPIRVNAVNGSLRLAGARAETRIDSRNADVEIAMAGAAPMTIYSENGDVSLTPPPGGYQLDAVIVEGQIEPDTAVKRLGLTYTTHPDESRASGAVNGGGPTITVRTTRGRLTLKP